MIELNNVSKVYPNGSGIHNISFKISGYGVYGILGPNGAGKSTLLNVITGCTSTTESSCTNITAPNG